MTKTEFELAILKNNLDADSPGMDKIERFIELSLAIIANWRTNKNEYVCKIQFQNFIGISRSDFIGWYAPALQARLRTLNIHSYIDDNNNTYPSLRVTAYDLVASIKNYDQKKNLL